MVAAHSGALAGEEGAYQALFDAYGVAQVATLDELADTCELLAGRRAAPGGLAAIHDSGGERAHLLDVAERVGVGFAAISEATRERLAAVLEPGLPPTNPLDAWGTGNDADQIFAACSAALLEDPATGALALNLDLTTEPTPETSYTGLAVTALDSTAKPVAVVANLSSAVDTEEASTLRAAGVPVLEGTASGLAAFGHLFAYRDFLARVGSGVVAGSGAVAEVRAGAGAEAEVGTGAGAVDSRARPASGSATLPHRGTRSGSAALEAARGPGAQPDRGDRVGRDRDDGVGRDRDHGVGWDRERWRGRLGEGRAFDEAEGLALLADWGIPVVAAEVATDLDGTLAAAGRVGWPVVLKTAAPGVAHKSDLDGVRLGVDGPERPAAAYAELAGRLGPLVMVAAGGVLVEVLRDRRFALPPVDHGRALAMLDRLAVRPLLDGVRGGRPVDRDAVADALVRLSDLAVDLGDRLDALDVNPLLAGPDGCVAVDALVVPAASPGSGS